MAGSASKLLLLTLLPVLAIGAPWGGSSASTQAGGGTTVTVTVTKNACGGNGSSSTSQLPTNATGLTSSSVPISTISASGSAQPTQNSCGQWVVPGTGTFTNKSLFTFTGSTLPAGLSASNYEVDDQSGGAPFNHVFDPANVAISGGYLNLKVPGGQNPTSNTAISSAEIVTNTNILYGSVRTNAILSTVPGTCQGKSSQVPRNPHPDMCQYSNVICSHQSNLPQASFFYQSDTQEIDIEYLTNTTSTSNPGPNSPPWLQYTNQATRPGGTPTYSPGPPPLNVATLHEYRIDWIPGKTMFFLDGLLQQTFTTNVPSKAGPWVWNNWSNGDDGWSCGPPISDNVFKIQSIEMFYDVPSQSC
jgi:Glycosyl hydrolases family 16